MATQTISVGNGGSIKITYAEDNISALANTSRITVSKIEYYTTNQYDYVGGSSYKDATYFQTFRLSFAGKTIISKEGNTCAAYIVNTYNWYPISNATGNATITHEADGSKSGTFSISFTMSGGGMGANTNKSGEGSSIGLTTITRAFSITFNGNGGTPSEQTIIETNQSHWILPNSNPVRSGYSFVGWFTEETGGTQITTDAIVSLTDVIIIYAHWELQTVFHLIQNESEVLAPLVYIVENERATQAVGLYVVENETAYQCI